jgi:hypothetical protein
MGGPNNQVVMSQNNIIRAKMSEVLNILPTQHESLKNKFLQVKRTVGSFANRPAQVSGGFFAPRRATTTTVQQGSSGGSGGNSGGGRDYPTTLSKCPKKLFALWEEFEFGL